MRIALLLAAASCQSSPVPRSVAAPSAEPERVTVRMARDGEFPSPLQGCTTSDPLGCVALQEWSCHLDGERAPALVGAVDAFARANLIQPLDKFTGYATRTIETHLEGSDDHHADGFFTEIVVRPRSKLGEVTVWQRTVRGEYRWAADIVYCMHVIAHPGGLEVVLDELTRIIG